MFGGGIIPDDDIPKLKGMGVTEIFTPGSSTQDIVQWIRTQHSSARVAGWLGRLPRRVDVYEVGPRDGLQNELRTLPTKDKARGSSRRSWPPGRSASR